MIKKILFLSVLIAAQAHADQGTLLPSQLKSVKADTATNALSGATTALPTAVVTPSAPLVPLQNKASVKTTNPASSGAINLSTDNSKTSVSPTPVVADNYNTDNAAKTNHEVNNTPHFVKSNKLSYAERKKKAQAQRNEYKTIVVRSNASNVYKEPELNSPSTQLLDSTVASDDQSDVEKYISKLSETETNKLSESRVEIMVNSGQTYMVRVAKDYLNRIITPFKNPIIPTTSNFDYKISGNIIYLTPQSNKPISVFITDKDNQQQSINVVFVPTQILPREVVFNFEGQQSNGDSITEAQFTELAENLNPKTVDPLQEHVVNVMKDLAKGTIPKGYSQSKLLKEKAPQCQFQSMSSEPAQMYDSVDKRLFVYKVTNNANGQQSILENSCYRTGVLSVAAYPFVNLEVGQSTELYVLTEKSIATNGNQQRQRLVTE